MSDAVTPRPIAASEHVELRAWTLEDAEPLLALVEENRDFLRRWLPWVDTTRRVEDELEFLRAVQAGYAGSALQLAIAVGGQLAGSCGLVEIGQADRSAEVGYWLAEPHNGRGHMTAACRALVDHGFDALRLHRAVIRAATENAPSRAVAERLGFRLEGVEREAQLVNGEFVDLARYAVLRSEWFRIGRPTGEGTGRSQ